MLRTANDFRSRFHMTQNVCMGLALYAGLLFVVLSLVSVWFNDVCFVWGCYYSATSRDEVGRVRFPPRLFPGSSLSTSKHSYSYRVFGAKTCHNIIFAVLFSWCALLYAVRTEVSSFYFLLYCPFLLFPFTVRLIYPFFAAGFLFRISCFCRWGRGAFTDR